MLTALNPRQRASAPAFASSRLGACALLAALALSTACGEAKKIVAEGNATNAGNSNVFAISVEVRTPAGATTAGYVQAIDRSMFDGRLIDNSLAQEYQQIPRLMTMDGSVFVGPRTEPALHRYSVGSDANNTMTETGVVSVADYGDQFIDIGFIPNISSTKAYYFAKATQKGVIINPNAMTLDGDFDITGAQRSGFGGNILHQGIIQFEHAVVGNRAFESALSSVNSPQSFYTSMTVDVYDTDNNAFLKTIEDDRCYGASTMVKDPNTGDVYVSSYSYTGRIYQNPNFAYKPTCVLRIAAGTDTFDPNFFVSFPDMMGGRECTRWYPVNGRYSYCTTIALDDLKAASNTSSATGQIWKIDLQTKTAAKVDGLPDTTPIITLGYPDGHDAVLLGVAAVPGQFDHSLVYRLVPATDEVTKVFEVNGLFRGFWPVR